jgi:hypothetical protein
MDSRPKKKKTKRLKTPTGKGAKIAFGRGTSTPSTNPSSRKKTKIEQLYND